MALDNYGPADILAQHLIQAGLGTDRGANGETLGSWPVSAGGEPDEPDACVTIYDTTGLKVARNFINGKVDGPSGVQVRVRAATYRAAMDKATSLYDYLTGTLYRQGVSIGPDGKYYFVHAMVRFNDILSIGKESPNSRRSIVTFNAMIYADDQTP